MRLLGRLKAVDALVHVPAERADDADVIVEPHLAVGDDVETGVLLVVDHGLRGVLVRLFVPDLFEGNPDIAAQQLMADTSCGRGYDPTMVVGRMVSTIFVGIIFFSV